MPDDHDRPIMTTTLASFKGEEGAGDEGPWKLPQALRPKKATKPIMAPLLVQRDTLTARVSPPRGPQLVSSEQGPLPAHKTTVNVRDMMVWQQISVGHEARALQGWHQSTSAAHAFHARRVANLQEQLRIAKAQGEALAAQHVALEMQQQAISRELQVPGPLTRHEKVIQQEWPNYSPPDRSPRRRRHRNHPPLPPFDTTSSPSATAHSTHRDRDGSSSEGHARRDERSHKHFKHSQDSNLQQLADAEGRSAAGAAEPVLLPQLSPRGDPPASPRNHGLMHAIDTTIPADGSPPLLFSRPFTTSMNRLGTTWRPRTTAQRVVADVRGQLVAALSVEQWDAERAQLEEVRAVRKQLEEWCDETQAAHASLRDALQQQCDDARAVETLSDSKFKALSDYRLVVEKRLKQMKSAHMAAMSRQLNLLVGAQGEESANCATGERIAAIVAASAADMARKGRAATSHRSTRTSAATTWGQTSPRLVTPRVESAGDLQADGEGELLADDKTLAVALAADEKPTYFPRMLFSRLEARKKGGYPESQALQAQASALQKVTAVAGAQQHPVNAGSNVVAEVSSVLERQAPNKRLMTLTSLSASLSRAGRLAAAQQAILNLNLRIQHRAHPLESLTSVIATLMSLTAAELITLYRVQGTQYWAIAYGSHKETSIALRTASAPPPHLVPPDEGPIGQWNANRVRSFRKAVRSGLAGAGNSSNIAAGGALTSRTSAGGCLSTRPSMPDAIAHRAQHRASGTNVRAAGQPSGTNVGISHAGISGPRPSQAGASIIVSNTSSITTRKLTRHHGYSMAGWEQALEAKGYLLPSVNAQTYPVERGTVAYTAQSATVLSTTNLRRNFAYDPRHGDIKLPLHVSIPALVIPVSTFHGAESASASDRRRAGTTRLLLGMKPAGSEGAGGSLLGCSAVIQMIGKVATDTDGATLSGAFMPGSSAFQSYTPVEVSLTSVLGTAVGQALSTWGAWQATQKLRLRRMMLLHATRRLASIQEPGTLLYELACLTARTSNATAAVIYLVDRARGEMACHMAVRNMSPSSDAAHNNSNAPLHHHNQQGSQSEAAASAAAVTASMAASRQQYGDVPSATTTAQPPQRLPPACLPALPIGAYANTADPTPFRVSGAARSVKLVSPRTAPASGMGMPRDLSTGEGEELDERKSLEQHDEEEDVLAGGAKFLPVIRFKRPLGGMLAQVLSSNSPIVMNDLASYSTQLSSQDLPPGCAGATSMALVPIKAFSGSIAVMGVLQVLSRVPEPGTLLTPAALQQPHFTCEDLDLLTHCASLVTATCSSVVHLGNTLEQHAGGGLTSTPVTGTGTGLHLLLNVGQGQQGSVGISAAELLLGIRSYADGAKKLGQLIRESLQCETSRVFCVRRTPVPDTKASRFTMDVSELSRSKRCSYGGGIGTKPSESGSFRNFTVQLALPVSPGEYHIFHASRGVCGLACLNNVPQTFSGANMLLREVRSARKLQDNLRVSMRVESAMAYRASSEGKSPTMMFRQETSRLNAMVASAERTAAMTDEMRTTSTSGRRSFAGGSDSKRTSRAGSSKRQSHIGFSNTQDGTHEEAPADAYDHAVDGGGPSPWCVLSVPLVTPGSDEVYGVIAAVNKRRGRFVRADVAALQRIGRQASVLFAIAGAAEAHERQASLALRLSKVVSQLAAFSSEARSQRPGTASLRENTEVSLFRRLGRLISELIPQLFQGVVYVGVALPRMLAGNALAPLSVTYPRLNINTREVEIERNKARMATAKSSTANVPGTSGSSDSGTDNTFQRLSTGSLGLGHSLPQASIHPWELHHVGLMPHSPNLDISDVLVVGAADVLRATEERQPSHEATGSLEAVDDLTGRSCPLNLRHIIPLSSGPDCRPFGALVCHQTAHEPTSAMDAALIETIGLHVARAVLAIFPNILTLMDREFVPPAVVAYTEQPVSPRGTVRHGRSAGGLLASEASGKSNVSRKSRFSKATGVVDSDDGAGSETEEEAGEARGPGTRPGGEDRTRRVTMSEDVGLLQEDDDEGGVGVSPRQAAWQLPRTALDVMGHSLERVSEEPSPVHVNSTLQHATMCSNEAGYDKEEARKVLEPSFVPADMDSTDEPGDGLEVTGPTETVSDLIEFDDIKDTGKTAEPAGGSIQQGVALAVISISAGHEPIMLGDEDPNAGVQAGFHVVDEDAGSEGGDDS